ncbi:F-box domain-containing protein [Sodiomyces alkalinus F11]|uniref:F-box domain-containing protein n=1 Tax=Sodiomyces alkalinus (strain CBS 110278 / VKM F-3762 / F11) TaxID=1314773 RepID=A0A3N2Q8K5_SODAK|nr:F-box domain-containing protein [Sodiomyces alkalinus F11]ROT43103.1 F-box domain-containing protein [Sodiomyces alkalinus F11]
MGIFSFRKKDKKKEGLDSHARQSSWSSASGQKGHAQHVISSLYGPTYASAALIALLPEGVLERIFAFVCPHSQDETYENCEQSALEDTCMLCDMRDLAHCVQVCKRWRNPARNLLYHSIRIDSVHYCEREAYLAEMRKRRTRFDRNGDPEDVPSARLKLLCRTLREDPTRLGSRVCFFKTPYMLREGAQADLARTIAVLPHLFYVDLPEGLYSDDSAYATLRLEVEARCPNLQKMTYRAGSERSLARLSHGRIWCNLQVLELININMDPSILRQVLGALRYLRALKVTESKTFTDDVFAYNEMLPPFPALEQLVLTKTPGITSAGLVEYLSRPEPRMTLTDLSLVKTGVEVPLLHEVVIAATSLKSLAVQAKVDGPFKSGPHTQRLTSGSLETLRFEISGDSGASPYSSSAASTYYTYLASSILGGGLRNLRAVYVLDEDFADMLQGLPPPPLPRAPFAQGTGSRPRSSGSGMSMSTSPRGGFLAPPNAASPDLAPPRRPFAVPSAPASNRFSSNNPFAGTGSLTHTLEVFAKRDEAMNWSFVKVSPDAALAPSSSRHSMVGGARHDRPLSTYGLGADIAGQGWNTPGARRSVMVGNGVGGFVAIPTHEPAGLKPPGGDALWPRPLTSDGEKKGDRDIWR